MNTLAVDHKIKNLEHPAYHNPHNLTMACPKCRQPAVFIRQRPFPGRSGEVWMCQTKGCENDGLYFYPEQCDP